MLAGCGAPKPASPPPVPAASTPRVGPPKVTRLATNPIISPATSTSIGTNINGPSLIRAPVWLQPRLGTYYLYFADHRGKYIRLATADRIEGPWKVYEPGTLRIEQTRCARHIASPDVHVDDAERSIRMYFHCPIEGEKGQKSLLATSKDGLAFAANAEILGRSYFRVFRWRDHYYALSEGAQVYRSRDAGTGFETGPELFPPAAKEQAVRHVAVQLVGDVLHVYYSRKGDAPESIMWATVPLGDDWTRWQASDGVTILAPELPWEGGDLPIAPSDKGAADTPVRQLRDPAVFADGDRTYLLYSVAGESGIAVAEVTR